MAQTYPETLFGTYGPSKMASLYRREGSLRKAVEKVGFPVSLTGCNYLKASLAAFYRDGQVTAERLVAVFDEMMAAHEPYRELYPTAADAIIKAVEGLKGGEKEQYKEKCVDTFFTLLGDPRFGKKTVLWSQVSEISRIPRDLPALAGGKRLESLLRHHREDGG